MLKQVYYEETNEGLIIPALTKSPTKRQLVKWAGASNDYNEVHYDKDSAIREGFSGVIVHGRLKAAFLGQFITDWIGMKGCLNNLSCNYRRVDYLDGHLICNGRVTKKYVLDGKGLVQCQIWVENDIGERSVTGEAEVSLPLSSKQAKG
ncbi:MaoC/PaaZ C-terminal domain-containing protein [Chloroflexota bacterium]